MSKQTAFDDTLAAVVRAAKAGQRCPVNGTFGIDKKALASLCRSGVLRSSVYAHNYRVVEILSGEHKGLSTAPAAAGLTPYLVVGKETIRPKRLLER